MSLWDDYRDDYSYEDTMEYTIEKQKEGIWITKDGTEIKVLDMGDSHLINAFKFLERHIERITEKETGEAYIFLSSLQGEQAQYHVEDEIAELEREGLSKDYIDEHFPIQDIMLNEIAKRGLLDKIQI